MRLRKSDRGTEVFANRSQNSLLFHATPSQSMRPASDIQEGQSEDEDCIASKLGNDTSVKDHARLLKSLESGDDMRNSR